jgi:hypothetical protein
VNGGVWGRPSKASFALNFGNIFKETKERAHFYPTFIKGKLC